MSWSCRLGNVSSDKAVVVVPVELAVELDTMPGSMECNRLLHLDMDNRVKILLINQLVNATPTANVPLDRLDHLENLVNLDTMVSLVKMDILALTPRMAKLSNPKSCVQNALLAHLVQVDPMVLQVPKV